MKIHVKAPAQPSNRRVIILIETFREAGDGNVISDIRSLQIIREAADMDAAGVCRDSHLDTGFLADIDDFIVIVAIGVCQPDIIDPELVLECLVRIDDFLFLFRSDFINFLDLRVGGNTERTDQAGYDLRW